MVAGDCVAASDLPVGRGGGIAMAEELELAVLHVRSRTRSRTVGGRGIERSSSSRAAAMMEGQRDVIDFPDRPSRLADYCALVTNVNSFYFFSWSQSIANQPVSTLPTVKPRVEWINYYLCSAVRQAGRKRGAELRWQGPHRRSKSVKRVLL